MDPDQAPSDPVIPFLTRLKAAAEALIAPGATPDSVAMALEGEIEGDGPRFTLATSDLCLHSAALFLKPGSNTATVTLVPVPEAAPDQAALEAAFGPAQELVPRPDQFGIQTLSFDYPGPERCAAINADFPRRAGDVLPRAVTLTVIRQKSRSTPTSSAPKRGLFGWPRR